MARTGSLGRGHQSKDIKGVREGATKVNGEKCLPGRGNGLCKGEWRVRAHLTQKRNHMHGGPSAPEGRGRAGTGGNRTRSYETWQATVRIQLLFLKKWGVIAGFNTKHFFYHGKIHVMYN